MADSSNPFADDGYDHAGGCVVGDGKFNTTSCTLCGAELRRVSGWFFRWDHPQIDLLEAGEVDPNDVWQGRIAPPWSYAADDHDDADFVDDFLEDVATIALARTPAAPKPTSTSTLVAVHFDCTDGCDSPSGCRGGDG